MGKSTKLRPRFPNKPVTSLSDNLEERLNKIESTQARNSSNVFKYAFFFFMGVGLTVILYPEISSVFAGIKGTSISLAGKEIIPSKEAIVEQEYDLDDDTDEEITEYLKKPNKTFQYSEKQNENVKSIPVQFEAMDNGQDEIKIKTDSSRQNENDNNQKSVPVTLESFENIEDIDIIDSKDESVGSNKEIKQNTVKPDDSAKTVPVKLRKSDPLEGEIEMEENKQLKSVDRISPRKEEDGSKLDSKAKENSEKKTVIKEVKLKRMKPEVNEKTDLNTKTKQNAAEKAAGTKREQKLPKEILEFNATILKGVTPKKIFADGRRIPPMELLPQKPNNSSVKVWMFEEFLSEAECDGLIRVHNQHVQEQSKQDPILCFDSVSTLRKHLRSVGKKTLVTPRDFTPGTTCVNATFSQQLKVWLKGNWSYSTAFYPGESRFSSIFEQRVKEAMGLKPENGGKFQITSYPTGIGYKSHTDCVEDNEDKRDRVATVLVYLDTVSEGGETMFPELGIWVRPRKARALVWNNMDENGKCEPMSIHKANKVEKGRKIILQRWYYYKSFYSLGKRPPDPPLPERNPSQPRVSCDEYEHGSCRWYDEWNFEHLVEYERQKYALV